MQKTLHLSIVLFCCGTGAFAQPRDFQPSPSAGPTGVLVQSSQYPILAKYLDSLDVHPRMPSVPSTMEKGGFGWLTIEPRGGPYRPDEMVDALCNRVQDKITKYSSKPRGLDEFHLLVHYDKALAYNTPVIAIDFGYSEAVKAVAARIGNAVGVFDRIFVYVSMIKNQKVFRMWPA
jgi:hypothetical protein